MSLAARSPTNPRGLTVLQQGMYESVRRPLDPAGISAHAMTGASRSACRALVRKGLFAEATKPGCGAVYRLAPDLLPLPVRCDLHRSW